METRNEFIAETPVHPGRILKLELDERNLSQKDFAQAIGMAASNLNDYIKGKRHFSAEFALKLEDALHIPATNWVNMQAIFDLTEARIKRQNALSRPIKVSRKARRSVTSDFGI